MYFAQNGNKLCETNFRNKMNVTFSEQDKRLLLCFQLFSESQVSLLQSVISR